MRDRLALLAAVPTLVLVVVVPWQFEQTRAARRLEASEQLRNRELRARAAESREQRARQLASLGRQHDAIVRGREDLARARRAMREAVADGDAHLARVDGAMATALIEAVEEVGAIVGQRTIGTAAVAMVARARSVARAAVERGYAAEIRGNQLEAEYSIPLTRLRAAERQMIETAADLVRLEELWFVIVKTHHIHRHVIPMKRIKGSVTRVLEGAILIDRGRQHGVRRGGQFLVSRGGDFVAVVEVFQLGKTTSFARLVLDTKGRGWPPRVGDVIATDNPRRK